jgi:hypothetical protein
MSLGEMQKRGLQPDDRVGIHTLSSDGIERVLRSLKIVSYRMPDGCCAAYYPEANPLLPLYAYDPFSGTPSAKAIPVILKRPTAKVPEPATTAGLPS